MKPIDQYRKWQTEGKIHKSKEGLVEAVMSDLWHQFPERPSTFGSCMNNECNSKELARGSGLCRACVVEALGAICTQELALTLRNAIEAVRKASEAIRGHVSN